MSESHTRVHSARVCEAVEKNSETGDVREIWKFVFYFILITTSRCGNRASGGLKAFYANVPT